MNSHSDPNLALTSSQPVLSYSPSSFPNPFEASITPFPTEVAYLNPILTSEDTTKGLYSLLTNQLPILSFPEVMTSGEYPPTGQELLTMATLTHNNAFFSYCTHTLTTLAKEMARPRFCTYALALLTRRTGAPPPPPPSGKNTDAYPQFSEDYSAATVYNAFYKAWNVARWELNGLIDVKCAAAIWVDEDGAELHGSKEVAEEVIRDQMEGLTKAIEEMAAFHRLLEARISELVRIWRECEVRRVGSWVPVERVGFGGSETML